MDHFWSETNQPVSDILYLKRVLLVKYTLDTHEVEVRQTTISQQNITGDLLSTLYAVPFINMIQLWSWLGYVIASIMKCNMKLLIHSQTSTVQVWERINIFIPHFTGHVITQISWN